MSQTDPDEELVSVPRKLLLHALGFAMTHEGQQSDPPETWLSTKLQVALGQKSTGEVKPKSLFQPHERMKLGPGYTEHDRDRIRAIATRLVAGQVAAKTLNPEDDEAMKAAVKQAAYDAKEAYDAAVNFVFR